MTFLRELLAVILGIFISIFIMFLVFAAIGTAFSNIEGEIKVKDNSVLVVKLDKKIKDYAPKGNDPFEAILDLNDDKMGLNKIIAAIESAKTDDKIKGISIEALQIDAGFAQLQSIRDKLSEFKETGKFITSFADVYTQKNYYLSSVSDSIFLNPVGSVDFKGLGGEILYFKDFQDKVGVKMEVIRHGKYKSAVEPFLANKMSDENREQTQSFLNSIWSEIIRDVGFSRNKTDDELNNIADELLARNSDLAIENNMISKELYKDQYRNSLKNLIGIDKTKKLKLITLSDYMKSDKTSKKSKAKDRIAVIYAQGEIKYGKGNEDYIGQELMIKAIRKAKENKKIKAIVLRVNSPGGSGLASDIIWRELELAKKEKPLVVSMGNLAASGGYYISCNANKIFAEPTTITGSIGVFGAVPNVSELADKIGINAEQVGTNKQSVGYSIFEKITPEFYNVTKQSIEDFYKTFVEKVAEGRNMTFAQVDSIAQGRVWTGKQAKENGLVDELGSLEDAIKTAAELANLDDYRIRNYPQYKKDFNDLKAQFPFIGINKNKILEGELGMENFKIYKQFKTFTELKGIQARLPFIIDIK